MAKQQLGRAVAPFSKGTRLSPIVPKWEWAGVHAIFFGYGPLSDEPEQMVVHMILGGSGISHLHHETVRTIRFIRHGLNEFMVRRVYFSGQAGTKYQGCVQCSFIVDSVQNLPLYIEWRCEDSDGGADMQFVVSGQGYEHYL